MNLDFLVNLFDNKLFISIAMFLLGVLTTALLTEIVSEKYAVIKEKIFNRKKEFIYEWFPNVSIKNSNIEEVKSIDTYPRDYAFDFETFTFISGFVDGIDCFKIQLVKMMNTEKDKYEIYSSNYGVSFIFSDVDNQNEFDVYAKTNAEDIMVTFNEWVKEIYFIKKYNKKNRLQIGLGVKGRNEMVKIDIPLVTQQR